MASTSTAYHGVTAQTPGNNRTLPNLLDVFVHGYTLLLEGSDIRQQSDGSLPNVNDMERARGVLLLAIHHLETFASIQNGQNFQKGGEVCKTEFLAMLAQIGARYE